MASLYHGPRGVKIGMISTSVPHRGDPVAGRFVADMASALADRGHRVTLLAIARRDGEGWDEPIALQGVTLRALRAPGASLLYDGGAPERLGHRLAWPRALGLSVRLALAARSHRPRCDAWISHFLLPSALIVGALRGDRPHLAIAHGTDAQLVAKLPTPLRRAVLRSATARWYTHPALKQRLDPDDHRAIVSPMGFHPAPLSSPARARQCRVAVVARLVPVKGVGRAIRAVSLAHAGGAAIELDVIGDGPERAALEQLARSLGAPVTFHGALTPDARDRVLAEAQVQLHTATTLRDGRSEGAPAAVVEAMGAGRCVIATDSGGVGWLLGGCGVMLAGEASDGEIAAALRRLVNDAATRDELSRRARERAEAWTWAALCARIEAALGG